MAKVIEIAISDSPKGQMQSVNNVETIPGKGLVNDRHFKENNDKRCQITLIEIENINFYHHLFLTTKKIALTIFHQNYYLN